MDFCAVAAVAKKARGMRILQVGSRPQPFLSVIYNEDELLRKFGIEITPYSSAALANDVKKILETRADEVDEGVRLYAEKVDVSKMPVESQRAQQALKLAILDKVVSSKSDGVALECWTVLGPAIGVGGCQVIGMLADLGIPCACETDVLGAISAVLLKAATLGREPIFFADITVRHANDDNTELLWHCGPFPVSLAHPNAKPAIAPGGQGQFELRNGEVTICRMDALEGKYTLMSGQGTAGKGRHLRLGQGHRLGEVGGEARLRPLHPPRGRRVWLLQPDPQRGLQVHRRGGARSHGPGLPRPGKVSRIPVKGPASGKHVVTKAPRRVPRLPQGFFSRRVSGIMIAKEDLRWTKKDDSSHG